MGLQKEPRKLGPIQLGFEEECSILRDGLSADGDGLPRVEKPNLVEQGMAMIFDIAMDRKLLVLHRRADKVPALIVDLLDESYSHVKPTFHEPGAYFKDTRNHAVRLS
jgi:hypothetical protein